MATVEFDKALELVGEYGRFQRCVLYFLIIPGIFPCAFQQYNQIFLALMPEHNCRVPELENTTFELSSEDVKKLSIPYDNSAEAYSRCQRYDYNFTEHLEFLNLKHSKIRSSDPVDLRHSFSSRGPEAVGGNHWGPPTGAGVVDCDNGWHYELEEGVTTVVADWNLVCDKSFYPTLSLVLFSSAGLVGNYIFGHLQDRIGRKPSFFIYLSIFCTFGVATAFASSFPWWLASRAATGFTIPSVIASPFVLGLEMVGSRERTFMIISMNIAYSFALITLACVIYLVRDWSSLALATSVPFCAFFLAYWVVPESPRWLLARGRVLEAQRIMVKMARVNGRIVDHNFLVKAQRRLADEEWKREKNQSSSIGADRTYNILDLLRSPNMCRKMAIIIFLWIIVSAVYVGLSYYAPALGGDPYLNFLLAALAELPTYLVLWPAMEYWGRRWTLCASMIIGGAACTATVLTQHHTTSTRVLYCIGKFGISSSYVVLPLMATEMYPTVVRGIGLAVSSMAGNAGPIIIPLVTYLGADMTVLPLIIMGVTLVLGGVVSLLLPETLHQPLPTTLQEGEDFGKHLTVADYLNCCPRRRIKQQIHSATSDDGRNTLPKQQRTDVLQKPMSYNDKEDDGHKTLQNGIDKVGIENLHMKTVTFVKDTNTVPSYGENQRYSSEDKTLLNTKTDVRIV